MDGDEDRTTAAGTVRAYYEDLRNGDPLAPYFADEESVVKCGIFSRRVGGESVASGLADQRERTADWRVVSRDLTVTETAEHARFADLVDLAWTDRDREQRYAFDTRWTGSLVRRPTAEGPGDWRFVAMHVSTAEER